MSEKYMTIIKHMKKRIKFINHFEIYTKVTLKSFDNEASKQVCVREQMSICEEEVDAMMDYAKHKQCTPSRSRAN